MNKIKLTQTFPGSWAHITILVDGVVRFEAAKDGTDFWIIGVANDKYSRIGSGDGKSGVKKTVQEFLKKNPLFLTDGCDSLGWSWRDKSC